MSRHDSLRASDADRDAVVDRLRVAAGEGRLEPDELEQRVGEALRARTYADLGKLLADLPRDGRGTVRRSGRPVAGSVLVGAGLLVAVTVALAVVALVALLMVVAAAWWVGLVLLWVVSCGLRRRLAWGPAGRRSMRARHARRAGPAGFL